MTCEHKDYNTRTFCYEFERKLFGGVVWVIDEESKASRRIRYFSAIFLKGRVAKAKRILKRVAAACK